MTLPPTVKLKARLAKLEANRLEAYETWLCSLDREAFMRHYRELVESDPEQMSYLASLSREQLQRIVQGGSA